MSNRGRQNVASFLVLDLQVDWRRGAVSWWRILGWFCDTVFQQAEYWASHFSDEYIY